MIKYNFFESTSKNNNLDCYKEYPTLSSFLYDTHSFLSKYSKNNVIREKCFIHIITPEHLKATYELEISLSAIENNKNIFYLFTPYKRLDRLSIEESCSKIHICSESKTKEIVKEILREGIDDYAKDSGKSKDIIFEELWSLKQGFPCFINFVPKSACINFFEISFYNVAKCKESSYFIKDFFNPIQSHTIDLIKKNIFCFDGKSKWLYISFPEYMEGDLYYKKDDKTIKHNDASSVRIKSLHLDKNLDLEKLDIRISEPLSLWFNCVYIAMLLISFTLSLPIFNIFFTKMLNIEFFNLSGIEKYLPLNLISNIIIIILTSVIATRSFLLTENNMLKKYAQYLPIISIIIVAEFVIVHILYNIFLKV